LNDATSLALLQGLVAIPSLSGDEAAASAWLVEQMRRAGYTRAFVDAAGNAVGEMGSTDPAAPVLMLLGHIDTVPGNIPVHIEETAKGPTLYGRGSVDAKGPLATFAAAVGMVGETILREQGVRVVVVGAVEEEAATSKGARFIAQRFDGVQEPIPSACLIGEPSGWSRVTLGYKGRLLVELDAWKPMAHSAGPDTGIATVAVDLWNWLEAWARRFNEGRDKAFEQVQPSLRRLHTATDDAMHEHVRAQAGIRLPLDFDVDAFISELLEWATARAGDGARPAAVAPLQPDRALSCTSAGANGAIHLTFSSYEPAWRSGKESDLVRLILGAIRGVDSTVRPAFVVKTGTSDMNVVGPLWRCPILAYGPGDSALDHTPQEHILLDEYWKAVQVVAAVVRRWVGSSPLSAGG
jgi:LysW-gamma-L-lysine carboxypeptidase